MSSTELTIDELKNRNLSVNSYGAIIKQQADQNNLTLVQNITDN